MTMTDDEWRTTNDEEMKKSDYFGGKMDDEWRMTKYDENVKKSIFLMISFNLLWRMTNDEWRRNEQGQ